MSSRVSVGNEIKNKPFNPLLGETYEFVSDSYRFFAE